MAGWTHEKREAFEEAFYAFLSKCYINSKDEGRVCLGDNLYDGQIRFLDTVFDGLENDIHKFYCLKARQLGLTTIARALSIFYLGMNGGLKGALVFDTAPHKESARKELVTMIKNLPATLRFPAIQGTGTGNRDSLSLINDSTMLFMSAGVRKSASSGTLGRSEGLTMSHASEVCSYDNVEGMQSFEQSLSELHPDRLYLYESTARGFNLWYEMWKEAKEDTNHCATLFLGWWSKPSQSISKDDRDFQLYGTTPPTALELERIKKVKALYNHAITVEQIAWIRRKCDPTAKAEGEAEPDFEPEDNVMLQEQAWTEDEAFQQTGSVFFGAKQLTDLTKKFVDRPKNVYFYEAGQEFFDMRVYPSSSSKMTQLKVWEEPENESTYVIAVDPAYGENEHNCRSAIQVFKCYADGLDQVAEYAWPLITTQQLAWVLASLMGWYGYGNNEVRYILELNGPGGAVFNELRSLRSKIDSGYRYKEFDERNLRDVFRNVKTYIYTRPDSMGAGANYHLVTNTRLKIIMLERLRDSVASGSAHIRSQALVEEMKTIAREGDSIGAPSGMKDDRVLAAAFAVHCWEEKARRQLLMRKATREAEVARKQLSIINQVALFQRNQLQAFFDTKRVSRQADWRYNTRMAWRGR